MQLEWQQKRLLKMLAELDDAEDPPILDVRQEHGERGPYFRVEGAMPHAQEGATFVHNYEPWLLENLVRGGYVLLERKGSDQFDLHITPEGKNLVARRFAE